MFRNKLPRNNPNLNGCCCQYGNSGIQTKGCRLTLHSTIPPLWLISLYTARKILSSSVAVCARNVCNLNSKSFLLLLASLTLILRRSRTGTVWFYTSTSNKRAARPKLYTKSLTRDLKRMYRRFTLVRISINL